MSSPPRERLVVAAGIVWLDAQTLLLQRRAPGRAHGGGCLEFPGGKIEPGEAPRAALARELVEEWGARARALVVGNVAELVHHVYPAPGPEVLLCLYHVDGRALVQLAQGRPWHEVLVLEPGAEVVAGTVGALPLDQFLAADQALLADLEAGRLPPPRW